MSAFKNPSDVVVTLQQRNQTVFLRAMDRTTNKKAAELLGCGESTLSEWNTDHIERALQVISAVGLKIVPKEEKTFPAAEIAAYKLLARKAMDEDAPTSDWGSL